MIIWELRTFCVTSLFCQLSNRLPLLFISTVATTVKRNYTRLVSKVIYVLSLGPKTKILFYILFRHSILNVLTPGNFGIILNRTRSTSFIYPSSCKIDQIQFRVIMVLAVQASFIKTVWVSVVLYLKSGRTISGSFLITLRRGWVQNRMGRELVNVNVKIPQKIQRSKTKVVQNLTQNQREFQFCMRFSVYTICPSLQSQST